MAALELTAERIAELFLEVDAELYALTDRHHDVMIAGGAAIALLWDKRRITNDVDVVSEGMTPQLRTAVSRVARDYGLESDWFNDAAKLKAPRLEVDERIPVFEGERLRVYSVPPRYVLAMKLVSARNIDKHDIPALLRASEIESREELYRLVEDAYPMRFIPAATGYIIDQMWENHRRSVDEAGDQSAGRGLSIDF